MKKEYKPMLFEIMYQEIDVLLSSGDFTGSDVYDEEVQDGWTGNH